jgi:hypothetical protein
LDTSAESGRRPLPLVDSLLMPTNDDVVAAADGFASSELLPLPMPMLVAPFTEDPRPLEELV